MARFFKSPTFFLYHIKQGQEQVQTIDGLLLKLLFGTNRFVSQGKKETIDVMTLLWIEK